jgi:hypothetical protein
VSDENDVSATVQATNGDSACVKALFHIKDDAGAYQPCLLNLNLGAHL